MPKIKNVKIDNRAAREPRLSDVLRILVESTKKFCNIPSYIVNAW